jgi:hypothetical protein
MPDLGLAPHTIVVCVAVAFIGVAAVVTAILQEQAQERAVRRARLSLAQIEHLLRRERLTPHRQFWQGMEEALVTVRPQGPHEESRRQRMLEEVRLRLAAAA